MPSHPTLKQLLRDRSAHAAITAHLDALPAEAREGEVLALGQREQALLFEIAADSAPLTLGDFVPHGGEALRPVHHAGRNTIPPFEYFQYFQKRFARPSSRSDRLFGYNYSNAFFITPGYFVAYSTKGHGSTWEQRGSVVIDYHQIPDGAVPQEWPKIRPNGRGLQRLVYYNTRDFMRRVSDGVTIGRASKEDEGGDRLLDFWFTLVRRGG